MGELPVETEQSRVTMNSGQTETPRTQRQTMPTRPRIWIAADEAAIGDSLRAALSDSPCRVCVLPSAGETLSRLAKETPDMLLVQAAPDASGKPSLVREIHVRWPKLPIIVVTASDLDSAVNAYSDGAFDCLAIPFAPPKSLNS